MKNTVGNNVRTVQEINEAFKEIRRDALELYKKIVPIHYEIFYHLYAKGYSLEADTVADKKLLFEHVDKLCRDLFNEHLYFIKMFMEGDYEQSL